MKERVEHASAAIPGRLCAIGALTYVLCLGLALTFALAVFAVMLNSEMEDRSPIDSPAVTATISAPGSAFADECGGASHASHGAHGCCAASMTCSPCLPNALPHDVETPRQACLAITMWPPLGSACVDPGLRPPRLIVRA